MSAVLTVPRLRTALQAWQSGDEETARQQIEQLLRRQPPQLGAAVLLARMELESERPLAALAALEHDALAHHALAQLTRGAALLALGEPAEAAAVLRRCCELAPGNAAAWDHLSLARERMGDRPGAAQALIAACTAHKETPDRAVRLGQLWLDMGQLQPARQVLTRALRRGPRVDALCLLSMCFALSNRSGEALALATEAGRLDPESDRPQRALGWASLAAGQLPDALAAFEAVLDKHPDNAEARSGQLATLDRLGRYERIVAIGRTLHDFQSTQAAGYRAMVRAHLRVGGLPEAIDQLRSFLTSCTAPRERRVGFSALAEHHDHHGDVNEAFKAVTTANRAVVLNFDAEEHHSQSQAIRRCFGPDRLHALPRATSSDPLPVFVLGMPRSGTSLTAQILSAHPLVHGAGELGDLPRLCTHLSSRLGGNWPDVIEHADQSDIEEVSRAYLHRLRELGGPDVARVIDKSPFNFNHVGMIDRMLPGARIVHCVRDPADTCLSNYFQQFSADLAWASRLNWIGSYYREYKHTVSTLSRGVDLPWLEVPYEELVADPRAWARRLIEFMGLPWDPACAYPERNRRQVNTASYDQVRQPVHSRSVGRAERYRHLLGPLLQELEGIGPT